MKGRPSGRLRYPFPGVMACLVCPHGIVPAEDIPANASLRWLCSHGADLAQCSTITTYVMLTVGFPWGHRRMILSSDARRVTRCYSVSSRSMLVETPEANLPPTNRRFRTPLCLRFSFVGPLLDWGVHRLLFLFDGDGSHPGLFAPRAPDRDRTRMYVSTGEGTPYSERGA
jgi:hypothetical protein